jgi:predicted transcriptional regulator
MTQTTEMTVALPTEVVRSLEHLASATGRNIVAVVTEVLTDYVELQAWQTAAIAQAFAELDDGAPTVPNEVVMAWLDSLGTPNELPPPA